MFSIRLVPPAGQSQRKEASNDKMTTASTGHHEDAARTWTHIKVLYILSILLSAVVLALFVVCFIMVLEVQNGLSDEVKLRKVCKNTTFFKLFYTEAWPFYLNSDTCSVAVGAGNHVGSSHSLWGPSITGD